ncbi:hypothetical protein DPMN_062647 [Dreissena polymorpha]|uniref:Uncharacterized protein n=1 Tax=Dreissena polymorpha TaxID=45954 RepID=A0A9D4CA84_DREPO|nr:hypothetical protein DPMN_062647 [Dreissena polymorpha]
MVEPVYQISALTTDRRSCHCCQSLSGGTCNVQRIVNICIRTPIEFTVFDDAASAKQLV